MIRITLTAVCLCLLLFSFNSCTKEESTPSDCPLSVTDIDGNVYPVVQIGDDCWTARNLTTTRFADGNYLYETQSKTEWRNTDVQALKVARWCNYNNDTALGTTYGKLYNWNVASSTRGACPTGWHVPTADEVVELYDALGGKDLAGGALKASDFWNTPNVGATNSSGFSAIASGYRDVNVTGTTPEFRLMGQWALYWTSSPEPVNDTIAAMCYGAVINGAEAIYTEHPRRGGLAIRCVKDK